MRSNSTSILPAALSSASGGFAPDPHKFSVFFDSADEDISSQCRHSETSTLPIGLYAVGPTDNCMGFRE